MYKHLISTRLEMLKRVKNGYQEMLTVKSLEKLSEKIQKKANGVDFATRFLNSFVKAYVYAICSCFSGSLEVFKFDELDWRQLPTIGKLKEQLADFFGFDGFFCEVNLDNIPVKLFAKIPAVDREIREDFDEVEKTVRSIIQKMMNDDENTQVLTEDEEELLVTVKPKNSNNNNSNKNK